MTEIGDRIERWELQRREFLTGVCSSLELDGVDLDVEPLTVLAILDEFVAGQEYDEMDEEDWIWLHTFLAAYVAQVFIVQFGAKWDLVVDDRGESFQLVVQGLDGMEHEFSPLDLVYEDFYVSRPPEIVRILATAEVEAGVTPDLSQ